MSAVLEPTPLKLRWYFSVAAVLFIFVIVGVYSVRMAYDTNATDGYDQQQAAIRLKKFQKMQAADQVTLTTADWIDQSKGTVRIPIAEAMAEEVDVLKAKPVAMGSALPVAAPAPAAAATKAAPASAATPAPAASGQPAVATKAPAAAKASVAPKPAAKAPATKSSTAQPKTAK